MIRMITWPQFGLFLLGASAVYYMGFGLVYYRKKVVKKLVKPRENTETFTGLSGGSEQQSEEQPVPLPTTATVFPGPAASEKQLIQEPDLYPIANELVETLDDFIGKAGKKGNIKEEVLFGIQVLIAKYPVLHGTGFKAAISNYVGIALRDNCAFEVSEVEMASLWAK